MRGVKPVIKTDWKLIYNQREKELMIGTIELESRNGNSLKLFSKDSKDEDSKDPEISDAKLLRIRRFIYITVLSGGLGTSIILTAVGLYFLLNPLPSFLDLIWIPFLAISGFHLIVGIYEVMTVNKRSKISIYTNRD